MTSAWTVIQIQREKDENTDNMKDKQKEQKQSNTFKTV